MIDYKELYFSLLDDVTDLKYTIERIEEKAETIRHSLEDAEKGKENIYYPRIKRKREW